MKKTLLCIDDEPQILKALERGLRREHYTIMTTTSVTQALDWIKQLDIQVVISDYRMKEMTGIDAFKLIRDIKPDIVRVILSGYADETLIKNALQAGEVYDYLLKPWDIEKLKVQIDAYFDHYQNQNSLIRHIESR